MTDEPLILPDRSCGSCTLCCKVLSIEELQKPQNEWCAHCAVGTGCKVYDKRPRECSSFFCGYLTWPITGKHWFPASSKMVIVSELEGQRIAIHVDPSRPGAWRDEPFYSEIKEWAVHAAPDMIQVVVCIKNRAIVVLPDEDVDLGPISPDERIISGEVVEGGRTKLRAMKVKANDPMIAGMEAGRFYRGPSTIPRFQK